MSFWTGVSGAVSGVFLIDMVAWLVSGKGIVQLITGDGDNPLVIAIAEHIADIPDWAFYVICGISIVVLSAIMCIAVMSSVVPEHKAARCRMADSSVHGRCRR